MNEIHVLRTPTGRPMIIYKQAVTVYRGKKEVARFTAIFEQESGDDFVEQSVVDAVAKTISKEKLKVYLPE